MDIDDTSSTQTSTGWLSPEDLELVRANVPIVYVDAVPVRVVNDDEARTHLIKRLELFDVPARMQVMQRAYRLLGLLPDDVDVLEAFLEALREQAGGYYDPQSKSCWLHRSSDASNFRLRLTRRASRLASRRAARGKVSPRRVVGYDGRFRSSHRRAAVPVTATKQRGWRNTWEASCARGDDGYFLLQVMLGGGQLGPDSRSR